MAQTCIGTPYYMAPEIFQERPYGFASDMWALGCILYEMCQGGVPFEATNMPALMKKIMKVGGSKGISLVLLLLAYNM